jgi:CRP/FNR family transcriptional regulator
MRTRTNGEARERLRQLLHHHARRFGLPTTAVDTLARTAILERWSAGDEIVPRDDGHDLVMLLVVGSVKVVCSGPRGAKIVVSFAAPGQFVATGWLFEGRPARPDFRVLAHDELGSVVAVWSQAVLTDVVAALSPLQALQLMSYGWRAVSSLVGEKCDLLGLSLRDRVLLALVTLARDFGVPHPLGVLVDLRLTHAEVASMAVGSRANVTRAIDEMRSQGLLASERHRLVVTHRGLAELRGDPPVHVAATACG